MKLESRSTSPVFVTLMHTPYLVKIQRVSSLLSLVTKVPVLLNLSVKVLPMSRSETMLSFFTLQNVRNVSSASPVRPTCVVRSELLKERV